MELLLSVAFNMDAVNKREAEINSKLAVDLNLTQYTKRQISKHVLRSLEVNATWIFFKGINPKTSLTFADIVRLLCFLSAFLK